MAKFQQGRQWMVHRMVSFVINVKASMSDWRYSQTASLKKRPEEITFVYQIC